MLFVFADLPYRYVDENIDDDSSPPMISGFAVQIREGSSRPDKSARPGYRGAGGVIEEESGHRGQGGGHREEVAMSTGEIYKNNKFNDELLGPL